MKTQDYTRLLELKRLINNNKASSAQKKEYIRTLYENGNLSKQQYDSFLNNNNADYIINTALTIGGILLATWLLSELFEKQ